MIIFQLKNKHLKNYVYCIEIHKVTLDISLCAGNNQMQEVNKIYKNGWALLKNFNLQMI